MSAGDFAAVLTQSGGGLDIAYHGLVLTCADEATAADMREWLNLPLAYEQLPMRFPGSGNQITGFECRCMGCRSRFDETSVRGDLRAVLDNVIEFRGMGLCFDCKSIGPIHVRLIDAPRRFEYVDLSQPRRRAGAGSAEPGDMGAPLVVRIAETLRGLGKGLLRMVGAN